MEIRDLKISEIKPYEKNPRNNESAVDPVVESIKTYGFIGHIVVDKDYNVLAGHTRLLAAKKLGMKTIPTLVADHLDEVRAAGFRLAENRTHEFALWDFPKLNLEIDALPKDLFTGFFESKPFNDIDLDEIIDSLNGSQTFDPAEEIDEVPIPDNDLEETVHSDKHLLKVRQGSAPHKKPQINKSENTYTLIIKTTDSERAALFEEAIKALMQQGDILKLV